MHTCHSCADYKGHGICVALGKSIKIAPDEGCSGWRKKKEVNMKQNDKPAVATAGCKPERSPLAKVLDVEEDATWRYPGIIGLFRIHSGIRQTWNHTFGGWCACNNEQDLTYMISCPDAIILSPMLTDQELKQCQVFGVKYLTRNGDKEIVHMWDAKPTENVDDTEKYYTIGNSGAMDLGAVDASFFPSVEPNDCICVADRNKESF